MLHCSPGRSPCSDRVCHPLAVERSPRDAPWVRPGSVPWRLCADRVCHPPAVAPDLSQPSSVSSRLSIPRAPTRFHTFIIPRRPIVHGAHHSEWKKPARWCTMPCSQPSTVPRQERERPGISVFATALSGTDEADGLWRKMKKHSGRTDERSRSRRSTTPPPGRAPGPSRKV